MDARNRSCQGRKPPESENAAALNYPTFRANFRLASPPHITPTSIPQAWTPGIALGKDAENSEKPTKSPRRRPRSLTCGTPKNSLDYPTFRANFRRSCMVESHSHTCKRWRQRRPSGNCWTDVRAMVECALNPSAPGLAPPRLTNGGPGTTAPPPAEAEGR